MRTTAHSIQFNHSCHSSLNGMFDPDPEDNNGNDDGDNIGHDDDDNNKDDNNGGNSNDNKKMTITMTKTTKQ